VPKAGLETRHLACGPLLQAMPAQALKASATKPLKHSQVGAPGAVGAALRERLQADAAARSHVPCRRGHRQGGGADGDARGGGCVLLLRPVLKKALRRPAPDR